MKTYLVRWEIDIAADSPEEAAARALAIQRNNDPSNTAVVFDVSEGWKRKPNVGRYMTWVRVDLTVERPGIKSRPGPQRESEQV